MSEITGCGDAIVSVTSADLEDGKSMSDSITGTGASLLSGHLSGRGKTACNLEHWRLQSIRLLLAIAVFAGFPLPGSAADNEGEVARLSSQLDACLAHQRRLAADPELGRYEARVTEASVALQNAVHKEEDLKRQLKLIGPVITMMDGSMEVDRLIEKRETMRAQLKEAERQTEAASSRVEQAEAGLGAHMTRHALAARELPAVSAQCESLRQRLEAARRATPTVAATPAGNEGWGLEQGGTWSGASDEVPAEFRQVRRNPQREEPPTGDKPGRGPPKKDDPSRDPRPSPAPNRTVLDAGAGPYHEFAALCRIGWSSALARYSVGRADDSIIEHLRFAGEHMRMANATTFDPLRAWPDWTMRQRRLQYLADRLVRTRGTFRDALAADLDLGWSGHADELAKQVVASRQEHLPTCDSHYARLGYQLCFGQQAWQIAAVAEREGDRNLMQRAERDGRLRLQAALGEIRVLPKVRLASGRCVDLSPVTETLRTALSRPDWGQRVNTANTAFEETLRRLLAAGGNQPPVRVAIPGFSATPWTWGANLNPEVRITADEAVTVTRIRQCKADWSPNPNRCQAEIRTREVNGQQREFCCTGDWLTGKINVPGRGTVTITWPHGPQNRIPIPAGVTVSLGSLHILAGTQGDFDNDAVFALIQGTDASGRPMEVESPVFRAPDHYPSYLDMCRKVGSNPSR